MGVTFHCRSEGSSNFGIGDFLLNLLVILSFFSSSLYRSFLNKKKKKEKNKKGFNVENVIAFSALF